MFPRSATLLALILVLPASSAGLRGSAPLSQGLQESLAESVALRTAQAVEAVAGDSTEALRTRWRAQATANPGDPLPVLALAALDRLVYRPDEAASRYRSLLPEGEVLADPVQRLAGLGMGLTLAGAFRVDEAEPWLQRAATAARAAGDGAVEAEALIALASIRARTSGTRSALDLMDRAAEVASTEEGLLQARLRCQRGLILVRGGDPDAVDLAREGIELARTVGSKRAEAACVTVLAQEAERRGETSQALTHLRRVRTLNTEARNWSALAAAQQWRGYLLASFGQFGGAIGTLEVAIENARRSGNRSVEGWAWLNLADIAHRLDDPVGAGLYAAQAESILAELGDRWGMAFLYGVRGDAALAAGHLDAAREAYAAALEATRAGNPALGVTLVRKLGTVARHDGDPIEAAARLDEAGRWADRMQMPGFRRFDQPYEEGMIALATGRPDDAATTFARLLESVPVTHNTHALRFAIRARLAEARLGAGRVQEAAQELERALDELHGYRDVLEDRSFRLSVLQAQLFDTDRDLGIASILSALSEVGEAERALALAEEYRAETLMERVARRRSLAEVGSGDDLAVAEEPPGSAPAPEDHRHGDLHGFDLGRLEQHLDPGTALLYFVTDIGGGPTTGFVVAEGVMHAVRLPPVDSLRDDLSRFARLLAAGLEGRDLARRLGEALLDPLVDHLPVRTDRLVVVPDGDLHRLAFDALILEDGRTVLERFVTTTAPSASWLWRDRGPSTTRNGVVAFGLGEAVMPRTYESAPVEPRLSVASLLPATLPPLPGATREARVAARYGTPGRAYLGDGATEAALKALSPSSPSVIHIASHAVVEGGSLLRSALLLAPEGDEDGFVRPDEIARLTLDTDLVILSGCQTADGVLLAGEGAQGLAHPFLEAGARAVVASLWPLDDAGAADLMDDFYANLADGASVAVALREAKATARASGVSSRVWASLVVIGDGEVRPTLARPMIPPGRREVFVWMVVLTLLGHLVTANIRGPDASS